MIHIHISDDAKTFINKSLAQTEGENLKLRIAVYPNTNQYNYGIGFDQIKASDVKVVTDGIELLVHRNQRDLLDELTLDYVKMDDGEMHLIVLNPNDPSFVSPKKIRRK